MADQQQLDLLRQGSDIWNTWRRAQNTLPKLIGADLREADLIGADLRAADLKGANLASADLKVANLGAANLSRALLSGANLYRAELSGATLIGATLIGTSLSWAKLREANLSGANLIAANLIEADLIGADFSKATIGGTIFGGQDLRHTKGLETVEHRGQSYLSINTIYKSEGDLPETFVRGTGAPDIFLEYMHALANKPIQYYTCFISYSNKNQDFAERLYADLQSNGVRCWYAPEDLRGGDWFTDQIEQSIRLYDRLLLILSQHSVKSSWVEHEVRAAMEKEEHFRHEKHLRKVVLFPLKIDRAIEDAPAQWAAAIRRERHMLDFTHWQEYQEYKKSFDRLLRDLKASPTKEDGPDQ